MTSYFTGVIGAMIADSWLGKYRWVQKKSFYSVQLNSKGSCGWWSLLFKKTLRLITQSKVVFLCLFVFVFSIEPSPTHCSCIPFRRSFSHWQVLTLLVSGIRKYPQDTTYTHLISFSFSVSLIFRSVWRYFFSSFRFNLLHVAFAHLFVLPYFILVFFFFSFFRVGPLISLFAMAIACGNIKPCLAAFGGDQFRKDQVSSFIIFTRLMRQTRNSCWLKV